MEKYYEVWNGKEYPVREILPPEEMTHGERVKVADVELWYAIEKDYYERDIDARMLDNDIYFYCDSGFIASDPTNEEIVEELIRCGC